MFLRPKVFSRQEGTYRVCPMGVSTSFRGPNKTASLVNLNALGSLATVEPLIKDTPKEDKPPNKGQAKRTIVYAPNTK